MISVNAYAIKMAWAHLFACRYTSTSRTDKLRTTHASFLGDTSLAYSKQLLNCFAIHLMIYGHFVVLNSPAPNPV